MTLAKQEKIELYEAENRVFAQTMLR